MNASPRAIHTLRLTLVQFATMKNTVMARRMEEYLQALSSATSTIWTCLYILWISFNISPHSSMRNVLFLPVRPSSNTSKWKCTENAKSKLKTLAVFHFYAKDLYQASYITSISSTTSASALSLGHFSIVSLSQVLATVARFFELFFVVGCLHIYACYVCVSGRAPNIESANEKPFVRREINVCVLQTNCRIKLPEVAAYVVVAVMAIRVQERCNNYVFTDNETGEMRCEGVAKRSREHKKYARTIKCSWQRMRLSVQIKSAKLQASTQPSQ